MTTFSSLSEARHCPPWYTFAYIVAAWLSFLGTTHVYAFDVFTARSLHSHFLLCFEVISSPDYTRLPSSLFSTTFSVATHSPSYRCYVSCTFILSMTGGSNKALTTERTAGHLHSCTIILFTRSRQMTAFLHGIHLLIIAVFLWLISPLIFVSSSVEHPES